jgi:hypothetical protein
MTQALMAIEKAARVIDEKGLRASRGTRIALGFGIVAAGYGAIVVEALRGSGVV